MTEIVLLCVIFALLCMIGFLLRKNDRLLEKVMAKDYKEYKAAESRPPPIIETPKRKPLSWADDTHLEDIEQ